LSDVKNKAGKSIMRLPFQPHIRPDDRLRTIRRALEGAAMLSKSAIAALLLTANPSWAQTPAYSDETPIEVLAADPAAAAILNKDLPGLLTDAQYPIFKVMSLKAIRQASNGDLSKSDVEKTVADLQALPRR
jgi:hypothetical protein